jgi:hypothetical protein
MDGSSPGALRLPDRKSLKGKANVSQIIAVDAAGPPRERPTRPQRCRYGGKKKRHTLNTQVLVDVSTCMILCVATASGFMRDLTLSRQSGVLMYWTSCESPAPLCVSEPRPSGTPPTAEPHTLRTAYWDPETFAEMELVLDQRERSKKKSGRPPVLNAGEQFLLTLEFWREYRTFAHVGHDWNTHETPPCSARWNA